MIKQRRIFSTEFKREVVGLILRQVYRGDSTGYTSAVFRVAAI